MRKMLNKKGFTLMEMLIVVAIIAILVAIAIPTFTSSLTKAKKAADDANIRSAYAQYTIEALTNTTEKNVDYEKADKDDVVTAWTAIGSPKLGYYAGITVGTNSWTGTEGTALNAAVTADSVTIGS